MLYEHLSQITYAVVNIKEEDRLFAFACHLGVVCGTEGLVLKDIYGYDSCVRDVQKDFGLD